MTVVSFNVRNWVATVFKIIVGWAKERQRRAHLRMQAMVGTLRFAHPTRKADLFYIDDLCTKINIVQRSTIYIAPELE
ncbi:hypothetical protein BH10PSE19_BH10PSE19_13690 [soil metagenome]